jgi:hypothetical protein
VSRLRELSRTVAAASVKRLSQLSGEPALDVRHVIALSSEELERAIAATACAYRSSKLLRFT